MNLLWRITLRPNSSYFPGFVGWTLRKLGIIRQNNYYDPNDALDITVDGDTTTIRPKDEENGHNKD